MRIPIYHVDAFTSKLFAGNPAAVCPLERWLDDATMQSIAAENHLPETAFFVRDGERFAIRWFAPAREIDLCGHATLASAHVLFERLGLTGASVTFDSKSGPLEVRRQNARLTLDFPARPAKPCDLPAALESALGCRPREILRARDYLAVFDDEEEVRALIPNMDTIAALDSLGVIVTAPGREVDFVSRFFAPAAGVPEDHATGSAHCTLVPYWAERLGRNTLEARQVSWRGSEFHCELAGDRVRMTGDAVLYLEGEISV